MNTNEPTTPSTIRYGEPLWCANCKSYHPIGLHTDPPSYAPTPETDKEVYDVIETASDNVIATNVVDSDFARRLERERDEARAELAKLKANNRYQRGYHDGERAAREELKTPTTPTEGSAVEWVKERIRPHNGDYLSTRDALELAQRCDEAEKDKQYWMESAANATCAAGKAVSERNTLSAQLAAAQEELGYWKAVDKQDRIEMQEVRVELAAVQAEARELRELREALIAMREYYKEHMITGKLHKQVETALAKKEGER